LRSIMLWWDRIGVGWEQLQWELRAPSRCRREQDQPQRRGDAGPHGEGPLAVSCLRCPLFRCEAMIRDQNKSPIGGSWMHLVVVVVVRRNHPPAFDSGWQNSTWPPVNHHHHKYCALQASDKWNPLICMLQSMHMHTHGQAHRTERLYTMLDRKKETELSVGNVLFPASAASPHPRRRRGVTE
jgi:hypothetical protein